MKTLKFTISTATTFLVLFLFTSSIFAQLEFIGNYQDGMGGAGWNADGSGPEPYGYGHGDIFYYTASRDYVDGGEYCGAQLTDVLNGFPEFGQSLIDNGYSFEQVKLKFALADLGDDVQGIDYFTIAGIHYCNFYPVLSTIELDGEALVEGTGSYSMYISGPNVREFQSGFLKFTNISGSSSVPVQNVAAAFLEDLSNEEIQGLMQLSDNVQSLTGNGRSGAYTNVVCTFNKGLPTFPFQGLYADHEGFAGWDADGTGPEPYGNGHNTQSYYIASLDYDGIDPDPNACLGHFLDGQTGFLNTSIQLQYRGYEIGDLKLKIGLSSLGPDVEGEDWGTGWSNYYNNWLTIELDGESILTALIDTNKNISMGTYWMSNASYGKVYDVSALASPEAQYVAQSFLKDMGTHFLRANTNEVHYAGPLNANNGRLGAIYEITAGAIVGIHAKATFIPEGTVSGTWTAENSPYFVDGHLNIENGQTLTIEPGVNVAMRGPYHFTVQGTVVAEGTMDENIVFTRSNPNLWWDGFDYDQTPTNNDTSVFQHCVFKYSSAQGYYPYNSGGVFAVKEVNKILINHCIFYSNEALQISGGYYAGGAAIALWDASPVILHSEFINNSSNFGGAIFCFENSNPVISRNLFYNNTATSDGGALEIWGNCNPDVVNNTFALNSAETNGGAIDIYDTSNPKFVNNIFWENSANTGSQISITSNNCNVDFKYNDIEGGQSGIGPYGIGSGIYENNIDADPLFIDPEIYVFLLDSLAPSPCIDAGDPSSPLDPDDSPADMGCYYQRFISGISHNQINELMVYPNPATSKINIVDVSFLNVDVSLEIFNFLGQKVEGHKISPLGKMEISLDISNYPPGTYFCRIISGNKVYTRKFVKE
jgi:hypothetical protein